MVRVHKQSNCAITSGDVIAAISPRNKQPYVNVRASTQQSYRAMIAAI